MTRTGQNFSMYSGNTKIINVTIHDNKNDPVSLIGSSIVWVMNLRGRTIVSKSLSNGISVIDNNGKISIKLDPQDTIDITGDCLHELCLVDSNGNVGTVLTGTVSILPSIVPPINVNSYVYLGGAFQTSGYTKIISGGTFV